MFERLAFKRQLKTIRITHHRSNFECSPAPSCVICIDVAVDLALVCRRWEVAVETTVGVPRRRAREDHRHVSTCW